METPVLWINDTDVGRLVYGVASLDGHLAPAMPQREAITLADSAARWSTRVQARPREIRIECDVRPDSLADRQTVLDRLTRRLSGLLEVRTADLPQRVLLARCTAIAVELYPAGFAVLPCWVTITLEALDPVRVDVEPLVYGLTTARTVCPVGTATSSPRIWIYGACTNPVIIVRAASGAEVMRLTFTVTLGANDALAIDSAEQTIVRTVAGVVQTGTASGLACLTSGRFPLLASDDATADLAASPTMELAASSGTPTGLLLYHRRW